MKRISIFFLFLWCFYSSLDAQPLKYPVKAQAAVLYNPDTGAILFEKGKDDPVYPASIIKIATALFLLDEKRCDLKKKCLVTSEALRTVHADLKHANFHAFPSYILEHDGVRINLKEGDTPSLEYLLYALLLASGNDAANVIAENCSGSIEAFTEELNAYLKKKGFLHTVVQNCHGLHHPAQITTAYEMGKIGALAFSHPIFSEIIRKGEFENDESFPKLTNTFSLLNEGKYRYKKSLGGKTGYISRAGFNLVTAAHHEGRRLILVIMGAPSKEERSQDAISLFELAFREKSEKRVLFTQKDHRFPINVGGKVVHGVLNEDIVVFYFPSEDKGWKSEIIWNDGLQLPIKKGEELGKLIITNGWGIQVSSHPLLASKGAKEKRDGWKIPLVLGVLISVFFGFQYFKKSRKVSKI